MIEDLELNDGDTVKILAAQSRERNEEISLTHWDGRIIKGDYDVPELTQEISKIADLTEQKDVSIFGIVSKLQDIKTFQRKADDSEGKLRNFDILDDTGSIRVTVWGKDTELPINKGDVVKIIGGDVRFDDYTSSGYSMNTNFNTQITINPNNLSVEEMDLFDKLREQLRPISIGKVEEMDEDGIEVDVIGRIISISDENQFQRDDGSVGIVRSAVFADETGKIQLSFWDAKAQEDYEMGAAYQIENARTRLGMYDVDLNIGSASRVIKLTDEEASARFIPELSTLEKNDLYKYEN
ncbi:OB-fold nucleic acid binding domain-containing protein [Methanobrevibacter sp. V74]|uniref:OB-fold nucleic acid binding domain-containing protein n=1 Tax=Methanobrevibacter sp. V74 TaxID=3064279 RepID=UPI002734F45F|nr:OB-fold nucleic acid binding domain-containing protein [Methanobrevibacter sp. V74]